MATAAARLLIACLNVAFLLMAFFFCVSRPAIARRRGIDTTASSELCNVVETDFYPDQEPLLPERAPLLQYYAGDATKKKKGVFWSAVRVLELPLYLPRRLTIPDASEERWSKPAAVAAAALSPVFLSCLWSHATGSPPLALLLGGIAGLSLGLLAFLSTEADAPPTKFLSAWLAGGFVMSVAWEYVIANELLSLLVSAGLVLGVDPATLGMTVLAWGNSLGDLIANVAVAVAARRGGAPGAGGGGAGGGVSVAVLLGRVPEARSVNLGAQALPDARLGGCWAFVGLLHAPEKGHEDQLEVIGHDLANTMRAQHDNTDKKIVNEEPRRVGIGQLPHCNYRRAPMLGTGVMDRFCEGGDNRASDGELAVLRESVGMHPWQGQRRSLSISSSCDRACRRDFLSKVKPYEGRWSWGTFDGWGSRHLMAHARLSAVDRRPKRLLLLKDKRVM
uniref:Cation/calcium exchanger 3 n=1 Tax=Aegilops tauschii TaxID=37682 RepID=M8C780_AEGTA